MAHDEVWTAIAIASVAFVIFNYVMFKTIERPELRLLKFWHLFMFYISGASLGLMPFIISNNHDSEITFSLISEVYFVIVVIGFLIFVYNWLIKVILQGFKDVNDKSKGLRKEQDRRLI